MIPKNWHIIGTYKHSTNTITCVCGWIGQAGHDWMAHRRENEGQPAPLGFNFKDHVYALGNYSRTPESDKV